MGVCSRRTQRLSGGAGSSGGGAAPSLGGAGHPPAGTGTPGQTLCVCYRAATGPGLGWGSYNLLVVNKALSDGDAPVRLKRPEQTVNETYLSYKIGRAHV